MRRRDPRRPQRKSRSWAVPWLKGACIAVPMAVALLAGLVSLARSRGDAAPEQGTPGGRGAVRVETSAARQAPRPPRRVVAAAPGRTSREPIRPISVESAGVPHGARAETLRWHLAELSRAARADVPEPGSARARSALAEFLAHDPAAVAAALEKIRAGIADEEARIGLLEALAASGRAEAEQGLADLVTAAEAPAGLRWEALAALATASAPTAGALESLAALVRSAGDLSLPAAAALARLSAVSDACGSERLIPVLESALGLRRELDPWLVEALGGTGRERSAPALARASTSPDDAVREAAARALGCLAGAGGPAGRRALAQAIAGDPEPGVRAAAARAAGTARCAADPAASASLVAALSAAACHDADPAVCRSALAALDRYAADSDAARVAAEAARQR